LTESESFQVADIVTNESTGTDPKCEPLEK
jgi:hypothetical protein